MTLRELFGVELPIILAPMAGVQGGALAPCFNEFGIDAGDRVAASSRAPFSIEAA